MGMDSSSLGAIHQGVDLMGDVMNMVNGPIGSAGLPGRRGEAEERAKLLELDAMDDAADAQRRARKEARILREDREHGRARRHAGWGKSNLAMSGSKQLVRDARRTEDTQDEEDLLFEGQIQARDLLNDGRRRGNLFRINSDVAANRSTLSLGSKIYK